MKPPMSCAVLPLMKALSPFLSLRSVALMPRLLRAGGIGWLRSISMSCESKAFLVTYVNFMRNAARTDANQGVIKDALEGIGCRVLYIKWPTDLVVSGGRLGEQNWFVECKMPGERLTKSQANFFAYWPGKRIIVRSAEEAIEAVLGKEMLK